MFVKHVVNITRASLSAIIEEAKNAELCRNLGDFQRALSPVWADIEKEPDFAFFDDSIKAELLRLSGTFLTSYGRAKNKSNYQERGKNLLTRAIHIFEALELRDKVAEAQVILAFCYWNEGAVVECETILEHTEAEFNNNRRHPVYLQICINRMLVLDWSGKHKEALKLIEDIAVAVEFCSDVRLQAMFHNEAGILYWRIRQFDKSIFHYNEAIRCAMRADNLMYVAINLNNLANTEGDMGLFESAHKNIDKAVNIFEELGDTGWISNVYDTKAQLYFNEGRLNDSLYIVNRSLGGLLKGEDFGGLIEAYWTKTRILLKLNKKAAAAEVFGELCRTARERVGEVAVEKYSKEYDDLLYVPGTVSFKKDVSFFKRQLVRRALIEVGGNVTLVAEKLQITHQSLSEILRNQFPDLREEFGLTKRSKRSDAHNKQNFNKTDGKVRFAEDAAAISHESARPDHSESRRYVQSDTITPLTLEHDINIEGLDSGPAGGDIHVFFAPAPKLSSFGITADAVIAVEVKPYEEGRLMLINYKRSSEFDCGYAEIDAFSGLCFLTGGSSAEQAPFSTSDIYVVGEIIAYCPFDEYNDFSIKFRKLPSAG